MKVYRGFDKEVGSISYPDWIYVTQDMEQAKWYATKDGDVEDGAIIEYDLATNINLLSVDDVNKIMDNGDPYNQEIYTEDDLLWYQEGLTDYLERYGQGILFIDPENKNHKIYILFDEKYLKNGRVLSQEEFDAIPLNKAVNTQIEEVLKIAGVR